MDQKAIEDAVHRAVNEVLEMSGRESVELEPEMTPIGGLVGFTSLNAIEAAVFIEIFLDIELENAHLLFIDEEHYVGVPLETVSRRIHEQFTRDEQRAQ